MKQSSLNKARGHSTNPVIQQPRKLIRDYLDESAPRRPKLLRNNNQHQQQKPAQRMSSLQDLGVIVEQVILHSQRTDSRPVLRSNQDRNCSFEAETLKQMATPPTITEQSVGDQEQPQYSSSPSRQEIKFLDGATSLLFSANKLQVIGDDHNMQSNSRGQSSLTLKSDKRQGNQGGGGNDYEGTPEYLQSTSQIKVKINNEEHRKRQMADKSLEHAGKDLRDLKQVTEVISVLKEDSLFGESRKDSVNKKTPSMLDDQELGATHTTVNVSKRKVHINTGHSDQFNKVGGDHQREKVNVTPSTVYNNLHFKGSETANSFNATSTFHQFSSTFKPTLFPVNQENTNKNHNVDAGRGIGAKDVATSKRNSPEKGVEPPLKQPKQLQNMMVNMLKQQVQKRRKFERSQNVSRQASQREQLQRSQLSQQSTMREDAGCQTHPETDMDDFQQQIVFNMLTPREPARQIYVTTQLSQDEMSKGLIAARQPRTTRNNQQNLLHSQSKRTKTLGLVSRNEWAELCRSTEIPRHLSKKNLSTSKSPTKLNEDSLQPPSPRKTPKKNKPLHRILQERVTVQEMKQEGMNVASNSRLISLNIQTPTQQTSRQGSKQKSKSRVRNQDDQVFKTERNSSNQVSADRQFAEKSQWIQGSANNSSASGLLMPEHLSPQYNEFSEILNKVHHLNEPSTTGQPSLKVKNITNQMVLLGQQESLEQTKKRQPFIVHRLDMSEMPITEQQLNQQNSNQNSGFDVNSDNQTLEKGSLADGDLLKNMLLGVNHMRNPGSDLASSNNNISVSLNDYEWKKVSSQVILDEQKKGIAVEQREQLVDNGDYREASNKEKLPLIKGTANSQIGQSSFSSKAKTRKGLKGKNYSTQMALAKKNSQHGSYSLLGTNEIGVAASNRAVIALRNPKQSEMSSSGIYISTGEQQLPPLVDEQQPSFFDHAVDHQSSTASQKPHRSSQHVMTRQHQAQVLSNLINAQGQLNANQTGQNFSGSSPLLNMLGSPVNTNLPGGGVRLTVDPSPSQQAIIAGKCSQMILRQRAREKYNISRNVSPSASIAAEQATQAVGGGVQITNDGSNSEFNISTQNNVKAKIPLTSLEHYYAEKRKSSREINETGLQTQKDGVTKVVKFTPQGSLTQNQAAERNSMQKQRQMSQHDEVDAINIVENQGEETPQLIDKNIQEANENAHHAFLTHSMLQAQSAGLPQFQDVLQTQGESGQRQIYLVVTTADPSISTLNDTSNNQITSSDQSTADQPEDPSKSSPMMSRLLTFAPREDTTYSTQPATAEDLIDPAGIFNKSTVQGLEDSNIFTLGFDATRKVKVKDTSKLAHRQRQRQSMQKRWHRFTFSNLDKMAPANSYQVPTQASVFASQQIRAEKESRLPQELYPKKSAILNLLEVNGRIPKANNVAQSHQSSMYQSGDLRSSSVPPSISTPRNRVSSNQNLFNLLAETSNQKRTSSMGQGKKPSPGRKTQKQKTRNASNMTDNNQVSSSNSPNDKNRQPGKTTIYLQKLKDPQLNLEHNVHGWSPMNSMMTSDGMVNSPTLNMHPSLDYPSPTFPVRDHQNQLPGIWPSSVLKQKQLLLSPQSSREVLHRDPKNVTGRSSDFNPDEEYETQYLSQVTRKGFFGVNTPDRMYRHTSSNGEADDQQLFERDHDFSSQVSDTGNSTSVKLNDQKLHKRLKDMAWHIKNHDGSTGQPTSVRIERTAGHSDQVTEECKDSTQSGQHQQVLSMTGKRSHQLQIQLIKQVNSAISSSKGQTTPTKGKPKEFKSINIQNWDGQGLPFDKQ